MTLSNFYMITSTKNSLYILYDYEYYNYSYVQINFRLKNVLVTSKKKSIYVVHVPSAWNLFVCQCLLTDRPYKTTTTPGYAWPPVGRSGSACRFIRYGMYSLYISCMCGTVTKIHLLQSHSLLILVSINKYIISA